MQRILVVEDEKNIRESLEIALSGKYEVKTAGSAELAMPLIAAEYFDMLITDIRMPGRSGIELLKDYKKLHPSNPVIVITAFTSIQSAVDAMKAGASEYVPKPFSLEEVEIKVKNLLEAKKTSDEKEFYAAEKDAVFGDLIGGSRALEKIKKEVSKAAPSEITVLITGDTGTGKELVAYAIHRASGRTGPFVPVHCAAYAKGVIESELFGHEKGAFTGADKQRKGKIEYAAGGTLFLDELGDIPLDIQIKLLRVLENRAYERVGGNKPLTTDARVICATNRDLAAMIKTGAFREDLYYRINVFPVHIPALRERREDIIPLSEYFLGRLKKKMKIDVINRKLLESYDWPGNVRELQNIIERAAILSDGEHLRVDLALGKITEKDVKAGPQLGDRGLDGIVEDMERDIIVRVLKENNYNQTKTAAALKVNRTTLQYKIQKYGVKEK
jgi:two-component system, NtrC family, response regulator AtoC